MADGLWKEGVCNGWDINERRCGVGRGGGGNGIDNRRVGFILWIKYEREVGGGGAAGNEWKGCRKGEKRI
jgi:hypothetical protein